MEIQLAFLYGNHDGHVTTTTNALGAAENGCQDREWGTRDVDMSCILGIFFFFCHHSLARNQDVGFYALVIFLA